MAAITFAKHAELIRHLVEPVVRAVFIVLLLVRSAICRLVRYFLVTF
jgi:hypothetical protein